MQHAVSEHLCKCEVKYSDTICDVTTAYVFQVCPSDVADAERVDCFPEEGATKDACNQRGCLWCESETAGTYRTSSLTNDDAVFMRYALSVIATCFCLDL